MSGSRRTRPSAPVDTRKLVLLIVCLALAVAATAGSLWYNLSRVEKDEESLFKSIVNRLHESVNASEIP